MISVKPLNKVDDFENPILAKMADMEHEQVLFCNDSASGLKAIIAIHNTVLGPSLGGTRMWAYQNEVEALNDVLRLSRGMTYKSSLAGLNLGGGKAVIIGDARKDKSEAMFRRFGMFVKSLAGKYITAEDVGVNTRDIEYIYMETKHVAGKPESLGGGGDPSPVTAYGTYMGIKAAAKKAYGNDSLAGKRIVVQGVGNVGKNLVKHLVHENAKVFVADIHQDNLKEVVNKYGVSVINLNDVYTTPMDIYAPCALGATVNDETLSQLTCKIIAGAANNQLANEAVHGRAVMDKGIFYAPDYLINAGGIINCHSEVYGGYNRESAMHQTENIYNTTLKIFDISEKENIPTYLAANRLAEERISQMARVKVYF
ncbi:MAG: Glu/Leu/Phe/Val dehydrogenase dimerization domain-containing protein [Luteibaculaceae bacterium]